MVRSGVLVLMLMAGQTALADQVTVTGGTVYVTKSDCAALVQHHPAADVTYQPGTDVHGKYVAPADLPGNDLSNLVPDKIHFDVRVNPLTYSQGQAAAQPERYSNTAMPVAHVEVDLKSGQATLNGKPLTGTQDKALLEACRKAGLR
jgi:hypothetical protein